MRHKGTKRSAKDRESIERAREAASAARVKAGLPAMPDDEYPPAPARKMIQLPSGDWWPEDEPVPPEVAALPPLEQNPYLVERPRRRK